MARVKYEVLERGEGQFELRYAGTVYAEYASRAEALAEQSVLETDDVFLEEASAVLEQLLAKAERRGMKRRHAAELLQTELEDLI